MTVYDLIKELTYYPPDMQIFAQLDGSTLKFEIEGVENEFRNVSLHKADNRAVVILEEY